MKILDKMRRQKAVYWEPNGRDKSGAPLFLPPRDIRVRWERGSEETLSFDGKEWRPDHVVYVGENLELGGMLYEGELADLEGPDVPPTQQAHRIKMFEITPTLKANKALRIAYL